MEPEAPALCPRAPFVCVWYLHQGLSIASGTKSNSDWVMWGILVSSKAGFRAYTTFSRIQFLSITWICLQRSLCHSQVPTVALGTSVGPSGYHSAGPLESIKCKLLQVNSCCTLGLQTFFFLVTALLRCNSHTIQYTHLKYTLLRYQRIHRIV